MKDLTRGNPMKAILLFSLPMIAGNIFQQFYNMVDLMVVGRFVGVDALAAVGATGSATFFMFSLVAGLTSGASVVVSQYHGAKDEPMTKRAMATAITLLAFATVFMTIFGYFIAKPLLSLLQTPAEILPNAALYLQVISLGIVATVSYNYYANILRAFGDSVTPLIFLIVAALLNIALDIWFVVSFGWGVMGVALATVISQAVSTICCAIYVRKKVPVMHLKRSDFVLDRQLTLQTVRMGLPSAIQNSLISLGGMSVQSVVNSFGKTAMAAHVASIKLDQLAIQPLMSIGMAMATYTAQNVGAGYHDRVKQGFRSVMVLVAAFSLAIGAVLIIFGKQLLTFFVESHEVEVLELGTSGLRIISMFYVVIGALFVLRNLLRGAGDAYIPTFTSLVELPIRYAVARLLSAQIGAIGIWFSGPVAWCIAVILCLIRYFSGKWKEKSLVQKPPKLAVVTAAGDEGEDSDGQHLA